MTLGEIRELVRNTTSDDWHRLEGNAPTYIGRFVEPESGEPPLTFYSHEARAVLVRDVDVGLAWGLDADPYREGKGEAWWAPRLAADPQPRDASPYVAEVLYRGQPVDRMEYAVIDNGHGLVPWPETWYPAGVDISDPDAKPRVRATRWQVDLAKVLVRVGTYAGSVDDYMGRCEMTVVG